MKMPRPSTIVIAVAALAVPAVLVAQERGGPPAALMFARLDADGDGRVTQAEVAARKTRQFDRADRNGDGVLDQAEIEAVRARISRLAQAADAIVAERTGRLDADGDGTISRQEFAGPSPLIALLDIDGDDAVSEAEFERGRAAFGR
jgi:hypothetical protein